MIAPLASLFSTAVGVIKNNWIPCAVIVALSLALLGALWRADHLSGVLVLERSNYAATKEALAREMEKGAGWKAAYEKMLTAVDAHSAATQACLDREVETRKAVEERAEILQAAQPRLRTDTERQQVVNDATRKRAADRLNRDF